MKPDFERRLSAAEDRARQLRRSGPLSQRDWEKIAALQACALLDTFPADEPDLLDRLYLAIAMGNASADEAGETRASFRRRFDWAVYHAARVRLGNAHAGRWHKIEVTSPDADAWFSAFMAELPARHPELIGMPESGPSQYPRQLHGRWFFGDAEITGPMLAAFAFDTQHDQD